MFKQLRAAVVALVILTVLTGVLYPLIVTVLAQGIFPYQANGQLLQANGLMTAEEERRLRAAGVLEMIERAGR